MTRLWSDYRLERCRACGRRAYLWTRDLCRDCHDAKGCRP